MRNLILISSSVLCFFSNYNVYAGLFEANPSGGNYQFELEANEDSSWTVQSLVPWITINGSNTGTGPKNVSYTVKSNNSSKIRNGQIQVSYSVKQAPSWVISTVDSEGMVGTENSIKFGPNGQLAISYYDATNKDLKYASYDGNRWNITTVDGSGSVGNHSSLGFASNGTPDISYQDISTGDLKFAYYDQGVWNLETIDAESNVGGYGTSLNYTPQGLPAISYYDKTETGLMVKELTRTVDGDYFWSSISVDRGQRSCSNSIPPSCRYLSNRGEYSSLGYRDDGSITASYVDSTHNELRFVEPNPTPRPGGLAGFFYLKYLSSSPDPEVKVSAFTSMDYDSNGNPGIAYALDNGGLKYAYFDGQRSNAGSPMWNSMSVDSGKAGGYVSLSFDNQGFPGISYYDETNSSLKYSYYDGASWNTQTVDNQGRVGEYTSIDHGPDGLPAISYYDRSNGDLKCAKFIGSNLKLFHTVIQDPTNPPVIEISFQDLNQRCSGNHIRPRAQSSDGQSVTLKYYRQEGDDFVLLVAPPVEVGSYRVVATTADGKNTAMETLTIEPPYFREDPDRVNMDDCRQIACTRWECSNQESINYFVVAIDKDKEWRVQSTVPWMIPQGPTSGNGPGTVAVKVMANSTTNVRRGDIRLSYPDGEIIWVWENHSFVQDSVDLTLDSDGDGLKDFVETNTGIFVSGQDTGTDPNVSDTDGDGYLDYDEVVTLADPTDAKSVPESMSSFGNDGGVGELAIEGTADVSWTLESMVPWVTITGPLTGTGPERISFKVSSGPQDIRVGAIRVDLVDVTGQAVESWGTTTVDNDGNVGWWDTSISHSSDGNPAISYYDNSSDDLKYATFDGQKWITETIDEEGNVGRFNAISHGPDGLPAIAYYDWSNRDLKFASFNGQRWNIEIVESDQMIGTEVSLSFSPEGNPAISYHNVSSRDLKFASFDGQKWSTETIISEGDVGRYGTSLRHGPEGNPAISFFDNSNDDLKFASYDGQRWNIELVDSGGNVGQDSSLSYGPDGNPAISYYDSTNRDLKFAFYNGSKWNYETVDPVGNVGEYTSIAHGPDGNPVISYYDNSNDDLKFASYDGQRWNIETVDQNGFVGEYTSLSYGPKGDLVIAYYDNTNNALKAARYQSSFAETSMYFHTIVQRPTANTNMETEVGIKLLSESELEMNFSSGSGMLYSVQSSEDLKIWETIESGIRGSGSIITRAYARRQGSRFFRVLLNK